MECSWKCPVLLSPPESSQPRTGIPVSLRPPIAGLFTLIT